MIQRFIQGESPESDHDLWCLVGAWAVSETMHQALGMPITGRAGDLWFVEVKNGRAIGFAQVRVLKNRKAHLRYAYAEQQRTQEALTRAVLRTAKQMGLPEVFTNDRDTAPVPKKLGFTPCAARKTGGFCRWEKKLNS